MPVNADAVPRPPKPLEYAVALLVTNSNSPNHGVQRAGVCLGDVVDHLQDDPRAFQRQRHQRVLPSQHARMPYIHNGPNSRKPGT